MKKQPERMGFWAFLNANPEIAFYTILTIWALALTIVEIINT